MPRLHMRYPLRCCRFVVIHGAHSLFECAFLVRRWNLMSGFGVVHDCDSEAYKIPSLSHCFDCLPTGNAEPMQIPSWRTCGCGWWLWSTADCGFHAGFAIHSIHSWCTGAVVSEAAEQNYSHEVSDSDTNKLHLPPVEVCDRRGAQWKNTGTETPPPPPHTQGAQMHIGPQRVLFGGVSAQHTARAQRPL